MIPLATEPLSALYKSDETAWLDAMARLIRERRFDELDLPNLGEYLTDMARRDRREVKSRLAVLMAHLLKWEHQPTRRSSSWRATIVTQRQELADLVGGGVLRQHALAVLPDAYANALEQASAETSLGRETFPTNCPFSLDHILITGLRDD